jgi:site-specific recombinase XerD
VLVKVSKKSKAISTRTLKLQINTILDDASTKLKKHLKSHSFRATYRTDLLAADVPIHQVKTIVGHKSIKTTARYDRYSLDIAEIQRILDEVFNFQNLK